MNTNNINPYSSSYINSTGIWNYKNGSNNNITIDPIITAGDRLKFFGINGGTNFLYFNTDNHIGVYDTTTGLSVWSINGTTGNIATIGSMSYASLSATSLLTNFIGPVSSTVINIGATSEFNWLKASGVSRKRLFPTIVSGDIQTLYRTADNVASDGFWYHNTTGNMGFYQSGVKWELLATGGLTLTSDLYCNIYRSNTYSTYRNSINLNELLTNSGVSSINLNSQYISLTTPANTITALSKYAFFKQETTGDTSLNINNIPGNILLTDWISRSVLSAHEWKFLTSTNALRVHILSNATTAGDIMRIYRDGGSSDANFYFNQGETFGYKNTGGTTTFEISGSNGSAFFREFVQIQSDYVLNKQMLRFYNQTSGAIIGSVAMGSPSQVNYNTTSDYRLKQDIEPLKDSLERVMLLQPKTYRFKHDVEAGYNDFIFDGFLAHECENIVPMCVSGKKDDPDMMQQLDYGKLTPILTGAIQELNNKVDSQQLIIDKMQTLIDSQYKIVQLLIKKIEHLENK